MAKSMAQNATKDDVSTGKKQEIHVTQNIAKIQGDVITQVATKDTDASIGNKGTKRKRRSS